MSYSNTLNRIKRYRKGVFFSFLIIFILIKVSAPLQAAPILRVSDSFPSITLPSYLEEYIDKGQISTLEEVLKKGFSPTLSTNPVYSNSVKSVWLKFKVLNASRSPFIYLNIAYSNIERVSIYRKQNNRYNLFDEAGNSLPVKRNISGSPDIIFNLDLASNTEGEYLIHIKSIHPIIFPATVSTHNAVTGLTVLETFIISLYLGVLVIMFLYNLFLYFSTDDHNYLYYTAYIFFLGLAQLTASGYSYRYFWSKYPAINNYSVIWTSTFSTITGILFSMIFLQTANFLPKVHTFLKLVIAVYVVGLVFSAFGYPGISYHILNYNSLAGVVAILLSSIHLAKQGFRPAVFFLIAWLSLLLSFIVLVLRNIDLLPYNNFTAYVFFMGSTLEIALLSLALADKINILRKEKEDSQAQALKISQENEQLVREQNVVLEKRVAERTEALELAHHQVSDAFKNLKGAQTQLVESEKMASLGQLTAGIAHEINNPINFVKSNIKPLQLDFKDLVEVIDEYEKLHTTDPAEIFNKLKEIDSLKKSIDLNFVKGEIASLMQGIEHGAERTAEIVRGLRTFSRLDESVIKTVNIHEGIDSTLVLLRSSIPENVDLVKDYSADGNVEVFPGKLNQVFMNILSNAIQAITARPKRSEKEKLTIATKDIGANEIEIRIKDTGLGMPDAVKQKIFDPFFTTKEVGEGTGLGLAIVFRIIQDHSGKIEVVSSEGEGSEFIITLHHSIPGKPKI